MSYVLADPGQTNTVSNPQQDENQQINVCFEDNMKKLMTEETLEQIRQEENEVNKDIWTR